MGDSCLKIISFKKYYKGGTRVLRNAEKTVFDYQKARGMMLAARYAGDYYPFDGVLRVVRNEQEWVEVENRYKENLVYRLDFLIGSRQNMAVNTTGAKKDIPPLLEKLKKNPDAALLLLEYAGEFVPRYAYDGGFSALFLVHQEVIVDVSGRGFDGRSLTSGRAVCDTFRIPWEMLNIIQGIDTEKLLHLRKHHITPEDYAKCRQQRIKELVSEDLSEGFLDSVIPEEYELPEEAVLDLVRNVIPRLDKQYQKISLDVNSDTYAAQGNLVQGKAQVWEIFDESRWTRSSCSATRKVMKLDYKKEMLALNDEIVAALYYLKVPYEYWQFLTLYNDGKMQLELQRISYDQDGYERIKALRDLLVEQRSIVTECWRIADEELAERARMVNDSITGHKTQTLTLRSKALDGETNVYKLKVSYDSLLRKEEIYSTISRKNNKRLDDAELERRIAELGEREKALGDRFFERFQTQGVVPLGKVRCVVQRDVSEILNNPGVSLKDLDTKSANVCGRRFGADAYGYAEFLKRMSVF